MADAPVKRRKAGPVTGARGRRVTTGTPVMTRTPRIPRALRALIAGCLIAASATACSTNPATGRSQLITMSEEQEVAVGAKGAPEFLEGNGGEVPSPELRQYVRAIGLKLAQSSERPGLPWEFYVLDSDQINAFALPGGKVFMSRGLLARMDNEAQLAGVLGHEVGHVTAKHIPEQMGQRVAVGVLAVAVGIGTAVATDEEWLGAIGGAAAGGAGMLYLLKFGRSQELEADALGVRYMAGNGYSPAGQLQVMEILNEASKGGSGPEILSTHPLPETRIQRLDQLIKEQYALADRQPDRYAFHPERFKREVTDRLQRLPPPAHTVQSALRELRPSLPLPALAAATAPCGCYAHPAGPDGHAGHAERAPSWLSRLGQRGTSSVPTR